MRKQYSTCSRVAARGAAYPAKVAGIQPQEFDRYGLVDWVGDPVVKAKLCRGHGDTGAACRESDADDLLQQTRNNQLFRIQSSPIECGLI